MKTIEFLDRAEKILDKHGWVQGKYGDAIDGYCMSGAIDVAYQQFIDEGHYHHSEVNEARILAYVYLEKTEYSEDYGPDISVINDHIPNIEIMKDWIDLAKYECEYEKN